MHSSGSSIVLVFRCIVRTEHMKKYYYLMTRLQCLMRNQLPKESFVLIIKAIGQINLTSTLWSLKFKSKIKIGKKIYFIKANLSIVSSYMPFKVKLTPGMLLVNCSNFPLMYIFIEDLEIMEKFESLLPRQKRGVWPYIPKKPKL